MKKRISKPSREDRLEDVGTLWTMRRRVGTARCALLSSPTGLEVRVLVDGRTVLAERCNRADEAFSLAERWRQRMLDQGWQQILPRAATLGAAESRSSA